MVEAIRGMFSNDGLVGTVLLVAQAGSFATRAVDEVDVVMKERDVAAVLCVQSGVV